MATTTLQSDGTITVNPNGDSSIALATADTYVDKNIVFNIDTPFVTNPNLLDNWYFGNPVNSYGLASYVSGTGSNGYCIDRWTMTSVGYSSPTTCSIDIDSTNKYITLKNNTYSTSTRASFLQKIYVKNYNLILGRKVTASLLDASGNIYQGTITIGSTIPTYSTTTELISDTKFKITLNYNPNSGPSFAFQIAPLVDLNIQAVKLELGDKQTLAHKEGSVWVLNEIMDATEEKTKISFKNYSTYSGGTYRTPYCNENLLDNWYFKNAVNQRDFTNGTNINNKFFIDRWFGGQYNQTVTVDNRGIVITSNTGVWIEQRIPNSIMEALGDDIVTLSAIVNGDLMVATGDADKGLSTGIKISGYTLNLELGKDSNYYYVRFAGAGANNPQITISAVKLEIGRSQTLVHQEEGLSGYSYSEIPDYGEQLRRCRRFYINNKAFSFCCASTTNSEWLGCNYRYAIPMHSAPSLTITMIRDGNGNVISYRGSCDSGREGIRAIAVTGAVSGTNYYVFFESIVPGYGG